jgi:drug/metabolite transporter (DMT)-like permease
LAGVVPLFFYFKGLSKTPASVGGFCELSQTFSALLLTWGVMGQALTLTQSIAGLTLVGAVYMANLSYSK